MSPAISRAIQARWRRLDAALTLARTLRMPPPSDPSLEDAAAHALHEIYDLWEIWHRSKWPDGRSTDRQNVYTDSTDEGRTTAALVWARGKSTHEAVEWGRLRSFGFGTAPFGTSLFGGGHDWVWASYRDNATDSGALRDRASWYEALVAGQQVLPPLETAARWLRVQEELRHE